MSQQTTVTYLTVDDLPPTLLPVVEYWRAQTPDGAIGPPWRDFDLIKIPAPLLPYAIVMDCVGDTNDFTYRYFGSGLADGISADLTGKKLDRVPDSVRKEIIQTYNDVIERREPVFLRYDIDQDGERIVLQEGLRLPLSDDGRTVNKIFSIFLYPWTRLELRQGDVNRLLRN